MNLGCVILVPTPSGAFFISPTNFFVKRPSEVSYRVFSRGDRTGNKIQINPFRSPKLYVANNADHDQMLQHTAMIWVSIVCK